MTSNLEPTILVSPNEEIFRLKEGLRNFKSNSFIKLVQKCNIKLRDPFFNITTFFISIEKKSELPLKIVFLI